MVLIKVMLTQNSMSLGKTQSNFVGLGLFIQTGLYPADVNGLFYGQLIFCVSFV